MAELPADPRCIVVKGAMCVWDMKEADDEGQVGYVRKHTGWLTNSKMIAAALDKDCPGGQAHPPHWRSASHVLTLSTCNSHTEPQSM